MTQTRPKQTTVGTTATRNCLAFKLGYRTLQWFSPSGELRQIPAVYRELENWEEATPDDESVLLKVEGRSWIVGREAARMGGTPLFQEEKTSLAWLLVHAAIEPNPGMSQVVVKRMPISLPNRTVASAVENLKKLERSGVFERNGVPISYTIEEGAIIPVDETSPAMAYIRKYGLLTNAGRDNGILDLGGGTAIARKYSPNSATPDRQYDLVLPGTYQLASSISAALASQVGGDSSDLGLIMDGIENGSYLYGTTGISFAAEFERARLTWINTIWGNLKTRWAKVIPTISQVLVIGGSAALFPAEFVERTKGRFSVVSQPGVYLPQCIDILGMEVLYGDV